ncbi:MAG TPA: hypothetical protein VIG90_15515 [Pedomonas sp.]|uniref:hypothetical protein n=1 Tax=Pedomonas sp. TaxID=2976421 RepID=UPI002F3F595D
MTRTTRRWPEHERVQANARERRRVFANFSRLDEGRSRVLIAICEREEDAQLVAAAPALLEALEWALAEIEGRTRYTSPVQRENCVNRAHAAIASARVGAAAAKLERGRAA